MTGTFIDYTAPFVILDVKGIGYKICVSPVFSPPSTHQKLKLFTSFIVRENNQSLYGFTNRHQKSLFEVLITVSGVGPKTAIAILGSLPQEKLIQAIHSKDITQICKAPGIGKKTAERLILEVQDKLPHYFPSTKESIHNASTRTLDDQLLLDALSALMNLGYNKKIAEKALHKTMQDHPVRDLSVLIRNSLKFI